MWTGSFAQRLQDIWRCLFPALRQTGSNQTRLSRPSAVFPFLVKLFQLQNHPSSESLWQPQRFGLYAALPSSPYASVDPEISSSRCRSLLIASSIQFSAISYASVVQAIHASSFSSMLFSRFCCCTTISFFRVFSSPRCPGCCFTCYRCICSYPIHSFGPFPSDLYIRSYCISLPPHSICLVRFLISGLASLADRVLRVPLDACLISATRCRASH